MYKWRCQVDHRCATSNLDGDPTCNYWARIDSAYVSSPPLGINVWRHQTIRCIVVLQNHEQLHTYGLAAIILVTHIQRHKE